MGIEEEINSLALMDHTFKRMKRQAEKSKLTEQDVAKQSWLDARKAIMTNWMRDVDGMRVIATPDQRLKVCTSPM